MWARVAPACARRRASQRGLFLANGAVNAVAQTSTIGPWYEETIKGIRVQSRVIQAVILRELRTRFGAYHLGYLWAVIVPLLFILVLTVVYAAIGRRSAHGAPMEVLLLSGMMIWLTFVDVHVQVSVAFQANKALLVYPMVTVFDIAIARTLLEFGTKAAVTVVLILLYFAIGIPANVDDPLGVVLGAVAICYLAIMYGHIIGCIVVVAPSMRFILNSGRRVLFFTSGALFMLSDVPDEWREYVLYNPLAHVIDMARGAWIAGYSAPYGDIGYVTESALGLTAAAAIAETLTRKKRSGARQ